MLKTVLILVGALIFTDTVFAKNVDELAKDFASPHSRLDRFPIQITNNYRVGPLENGSVLEMAFRPHLSLDMGTDWNLVSRSFLPVLYHEKAFPSSDYEFGLGDLVQTFLLTPAKPNSQWSWAAGAAFEAPTATDTFLGAGKWAAGPAVSVAYEEFQYTFGILAHYLWSFAGEEDRSDISLASIQPFYNYRFGDGRAVNLMFESVYNCEQEEWTHPAILSYSHIFSYSQTDAAELGAGFKYLVSGPEEASEWGFRVQFSFIF